MNELVFRQGDYFQLRRELQNSETEMCAALLISVVKRKDGLRGLVTRVVIPPESAYSYRTTTAAQLKAPFVSEISSKAKAEGFSVGFVHSHPRSIPAEFSPTDDDGEHALHEFLQRKIPDGYHFAVVFSGDAARARLIAPKAKPVRIATIGERLAFISESGDAKVEKGRFDRQVRAFGMAGQSKMHELTVAIVGLGGTGSAMAQQLAYLGVRNFLLFDPDAIEESNLNRLIGGAHSDIGKQKVHIAAKMIRGISRDAKATPFRESVLSSRTLKRLVDSDFIFCCTDTHGSRAILCQFAYQYYVPCIDMGISIEVKQGQVTHITGRVQMLVPGLACLTCSSLLDSDAVRRDLMTDEQRNSDPYFVGDGEPAPSVVSLNQTVASLACTMFLGAVTDVPANARFQIYDAVKGLVRPVAGLPDDQCIVCSVRGALGRGDTWPLPARP